MTRFLFDTATSFTGYIADRENSLGWLFAVPDGQEPAEGLLPTTHTVMVEGATTYEWVLAESDLLAHPEKWREFHGDTPVFVFTSRELPVPEGADVRFVRGSVAEALPAIRAAAAEGDVWIVGGGDLAGQFLEAGALDEIALSIAPVALDGGAPLFPRRIESDRLRLETASAIGQFARVVFSVDAADGSGAAAPAEPPAASSQDSPTDALTESEAVLLRRAIALSRSARAAGNHPFGALLADAEGRIVLEAENTVSTGRDVTGHAETNLIRLASARFSAAELASMTLVTSCEPCAMCSGALYWAGVGRMIYGMPEEALHAMTGAHPDNPTLLMPSRTVLGAGSRAVSVRGPFLEAEAAAEHADFWA